MHFDLVVVHHAYIDPCASKNQRWQNDVCDILAVAAVSGILTGFEAVLSSVRALC